MNYDHTHQTNNFYTASIYMLYTYMLYKKYLCDEQNILFIQKYIIFQKNYFRFAELQKFLLNRNNNYLQYFLICTQVVLYELPPNKNG